MKTPSKALPSAWIDRLFSRFSAMYGSRFADLWRGADADEVRAVWAVDLGDLSPQEIAAGVEACKSRDWPPTLPEFRKLCRPPLDCERAFHEAAEQMHNREMGNDVWSNPAIFWAARRLGCDLIGSSLSAVKSRWAHELDKAVRDLHMGLLPREIPPRRAALPVPGNTLTPKGDALAHLARMREMCGGAKPAARGESVPMRDLLRGNVDVIGRRVAEAAN